MNRSHHLKKSLSLLQTNSRRSSIPISTITSTTNITITTQSFSTSPKKKGKPSDKSSSSTSTTSTPPNPHRQPFVTHRLRPGQPNPLHQIYRSTKSSKSHKSDPLYRPPWKKSTKAHIISPEDFAARPRVTFEEQFDSLHDGMIVLGWINTKQQQEIYNMYVSMMLEQDSKFGKTSHEYVMRVIGQEFHISSMRVAAIVDAIHEEEQNRKHNPELVYDKLAEYADKKVEEHIRNVYNAYGEPNPNEFMEDPIEGSGVVANDATSNGGGMVSVDDLYDIDEMTKKAILREKDEAQLEIDGHVYKEDIELDSIETNVNKECMDLIKAQKEAQQMMIDSWKREEGEMESPLPNGGKVEDDNDDDDSNGSENATAKEVERRPRWKFVAQTINVRDGKKARGKIGNKKKKKFIKEPKTNTIVEQDGLLRVATVQEVNNVAWKDVRDIKEFGFKGVKSAWLNRKKGEKGGWGHVPEEVKAAAKAKMEEKKAKEEEEEKREDADAGDDNDADASSNDEEK